MKHNKCPKGLDTYCIASIWGDLDKAMCKTQCTAMKVQLKELFKEDEG